MGKATPKIKLRKIAPRRFRELDEDRQELVAPAEYEVLSNNRCVALLVKAQDGWRACVPTNDSKLGFAISPVDLNKFRQVRAWAIKKFQKTGGGADEDERLTSPSVPARAGVEEREGR